jgi:hypothetical protein
MSNDFVYDMSEINEEEILKGWDELADEADYINGLDDGEWPEEDEWLDDLQGEEEFA